MNYLLILNLFLFLDNFGKTNSFQFHFNLTKEMLKLIKVFDIIP